MQDVLSRFIAALRESGLPISQAETLDALRAVQLAGLSEPQILKNSLSLTLAKSLDHSLILEHLFDDYFSVHKTSFESEDQEGEALLEPASQQTDTEAAPSMESAPMSELAQQLSISVFLVIDAKGMSGSIVPLVSGFCHYAEKMGVNIAGVIANRVGSAHHAGLLKIALDEHQQPPLIAWMIKDAPVLPERHLGLVQPSEVELPDFLPFFHVEVDNLVSLFSETNDVLEQQSSPLLLKGKKIAIAKDAACCFIYPANLDFLIEQGAEVLYFSPLAGDAVPYGVDATWLPGGYPELFSQSLSQSNTWVSLSEFIEQGKPVLAECGGAMLLGRSLVDLEGKSWPMAGILPFQSKMQTKLASLGYREDNSGIKGHEFHHSVRELEQEVESCFQTGRGDQGLRYKNCRASYVHWYFASAPEVICQWLLSEN